MGTFFSFLSWLSCPSPSSMGSSPLLELPPELRNMIYEHALRYEDGLAVVRMAPEVGSPITLRPRNSTDGPIANPLKLVCRQFNVETHKLSLKVNTVHYTERAYPHSQDYPMWHFVRRLDSNRHHHGHIRRLFVQVKYHENHTTGGHRHSQPMLQASQLLDQVSQLGIQVSLTIWKLYSENHPLCEVQWAFDLRSVGALEQRAVLNWMVALELVITGNSLLKLSESDGASWIQKARMLLEVYQKEDTGIVALPTNFRLLIDAEFPEDQVIENIREQQATGLLTGSQTWETVEQVRTRFEQGIRGCETAEMRSAREKQNSLRVSGKSGN